MRRAKVIELELEARDRPAAEAQPRRWRAAAGQSGDRELPRQPGRVTAMRAAVVISPAPTAIATWRWRWRQVLGQPVQRIWHQETELPALDLMVHARRVLLRRLSALRRHGGAQPGDGGRSRRRRGGRAVLGICNGFQILTEAGLLPGALIRNATLRFAVAGLSTRGSSARDTRLHRRYARGQASARRWPTPTATTSSTRDGLERLEAEDRVAFSLRRRRIPNGSTARHRRHRWRRAQRARADAAPGARDRAAARRQRRAGRCSTSLARGVSA